MDGATADDRPLRIAYLLHWNGGSGSGVMKKVLSHARTWRSQGCEVGIFLLCRADADAGPGDGDLPVLARRYGSRRDRIRSAEDLAGEIRVWRPDVVYRRYDVHYPALTRLARTVPTILEINTNDLTEYRNGSRLRDIYNRATRRRVLQSAAGLVFVTRELERLPQYARFGRPSVVIGNGIALAEVEPAPPAANAEPRLVFLGSPGQPWHGVDKVVRLAHHFPRWSFDLVGISAAEVPGTLPRNVTAHGLLDAAAYRPILHRADVAIGTLALHRKRMQEASPLKVREYLATGIPTIIAYDDTDFGDSRPYLLQLPNETGSIEANLDRIERFVSAWRGRRVPREEAAHLDATCKEQRRLQFFRRIAGVTVAPTRPGV